MIDKRSGSAAAAMLLAAACGGGTPSGQPDSGPSGGVTISVSPSSGNLRFGGTITLSAAVAGSTDTAVDWSNVDSSLGALAPSGATAVFTASNTAGRAHLTARSHADPNQSAALVIVISSGIAVTLSPTVTHLTPGGQGAFTATVTGPTHAGTVTWSVQEGASGGTITQGGTYTAPNAAGTYHVIATSNDDATVTASAEVDVLAPAVNVAISPTSATLGAGGAQQFTATVSGNPNTGVDWSVIEGGSGGSINTNGFYTAPATAGTYHVSARSRADTNATATATITVSGAPVVAISISPAATSINVNSTSQFTATVTGSSDSAASWSVTEGSGGTITQAGLYTAPANAGTYHVVATSHADSSRSATATVTVTAALNACVAPNTTGTCQSATDTYCGSACCPSGFPYHCSVTHQCYSTQAAAETACGATTCTSCQPQQILHACQPPSTGGSCANATDTYCSSAACCPSGFPYFCSVSNRCYAQQTDAESACGNTTCTSCQPSQATNACVPASGNNGTCNPGNLYCTTACCPNAYPYFCPKDSICYAAIGDAEAACGTSNTCVTCRP